MKGLKSSLNPLNNMTQPEKQKVLELSVQKLKRAAGFAECMLGNPVNMATVSTLNTLTIEAMAQVNDLKSITAGEERPKVG